MQNLANLVGPGFAKDIFFTGRRLDAAEALRIGLVNRVAEPDKLDALLEEYTAAIKTGAPLTIRAGKRIVREVLKPVRCRHGSVSAFDRRLFRQRGLHRGTPAFMEKRKPQFKGR